MKHWKGILQRLRTSQPDQVHLLILIPSLTLVFLSLVVRTASSAIDPTLEKKKIVDQLKQRLSEVQNDEEIKVTLTTKSSTRGRGGAAAPQWGFDSCAADLSLPNQSVAGDPACELSTFALLYGGEVRETQNEFPAFTLQKKQEQFSLRVFRDRTDSELSTHAEKPAPKGSTLDMSFRVQPLGHGRDKLARRVVNLTIAFEHGSASPAEYFGTVSGDFDGQGLSFGILQWNLKSCSLQPLLEAFLRQDNARFHAIMGTDTNFLKQLIAVPCDKAPALARRVMLGADGQVKESWSARFQALGRERIFQEVQVQFLLPQVQKAYSLAEELDFHSERAIALLFDILIQNGGISSFVRIEYEQDVLDSERSLGRDLNEVERMRLLANRQAEAAKPKWVDTVRARKLTIVDGAGSVNGISYNLDALGIRLRNYKTGKAVSPNAGEDTLKRLDHGEVSG